MGCPGRRWEIVDADPSGALRDRRGKASTGGLSRVRIRLKPCRLEQVSRKHGLSGNHGFGEDFKWPRTEPHAIHEGRRAQRGWLSIGLLTEGPASPNGRYVGHGGGRPGPRDLMKPRIKPSISIIIGITITTKETYAYSYQVWGDTA